MSPAMKGSRETHPEARAGAQIARRQLLTGVPLAALAATLPHGLFDVAPAHAADGAITTVFVAGATGNTGRRVVAELRARGYSVIAGVRDEKKAASLGLAADGGVKVVRADVTEPAEKLAGVMQGAQAVIIATGFRPLDSKNTAAKVDFEGTVHVLDAARQVGATKLVLVSSLLTNAREVGQESNPNFKFLNAGFLGKVLDQKRFAERAIADSGIDYTIVRPGGLSGEPPLGALRVCPEDTLFGLEGDPGREISRDTVAAVCVEALTAPGASKKVVEIVEAAGKTAVPRSDWFSGAICRV
ncbi:unnamed protein product [Pedinophyceae sp. YPF-701]|nr:unnamed protein product [Pedinophyceae sp. YPF-701]